MGEQLPKTRVSLVRRLNNAADHEAWNEFTAIYEPLLLRLLRRDGLQESDALDICQQVLAAVARDVDRWKPDGRDRTFRRWLFQIARNRVIKFLNGERKRARGVGGSGAHAALEQVPDKGESLSEVFAREYRQQLLLRAAEAIQAEFREATWDAFWLTAIDGYQIVDVADRLGMSVGSVYVARSRIMARLRSKVREITDQ
jgi:RNA polymerase sigma factor (sigma-70 family)